MSVQWLKLSLDQVVSLTRSCLVPRDRGSFSHLLCCGPPEWWEYRLPPRHGHIRGTTWAAEAVLAPQGRT